MPKLSSKGGGGTRWGHHVYNIYRECPRKYYLTFLAPTPDGNTGWENPQGNSNMILGTLGHAFLHGFHEKGTVEAGRRKLKKAWAEETGKWKILEKSEVISDITDQLNRIIEVYPKFHSEYEIRRGAMKFLSFEEKVTINLPEVEGIVASGLLPVPYTSRRDAIIQQKGRGRGVFESKFSTMQFSKMVDFHRLGGQTSGYIITEQQTGNECFGAIINHVRPLKTPQIDRHLILKTPADLKAWAESITRTYLEIQQKDPKDIRAWTQHLDQCVTFTSVCPMRDVCLIHSMAGQEAFLKQTFRPKSID